MIHAQVLTHEGSYEMEILMQALIRALPQPHHKYDKNLLKMLQLLIKTRHQYPKVLEVSLIFIAGVYSIRLFIENSIA